MAILQPMSSFDVLIDSSAFIARMAEGDPFLEDARRGFQMLKTQQLRVAVTNLIIGETLTVLSHRGGQALARQFMGHIERSEMPIIFVNEDLHQTTVQLFCQQAKKGTSFVDCANVVVVRHLGISKIFSFDEFHRRAGVQTFVTRQAPVQNSHET